MKVKPSMNDAVAQDNAVSLSESDRKVIAGIQSGLPLVSRPYAEIGKAIGMP